MHLYNVKIDALKMSQKYITNLVTITTFLKKTKGAARFIQPFLLLNCNNNSKRINFVITCVRDSILIKGNIAGSRKNDQDQVQTKIYQS